MQRNYTWASSELYKRFGEALPYSPVYLFEVEWLDEMGLLRGNNILNKLGIKIGEINIEQLKPFVLYSV